ncbi:hypothetical protein F0562_031973 [Nyssa sinensis]|uniref:Uncharacterized protein n=1 Tax=Nyssa sinensis TaxID=561372 RepID=A0A5J5AXA5_9ASTE|nr:hypothetical protein F0562_031973 [Nyssa sinensis]
MASTPVTPVSIHSLVTIKLTKDNYLLWKAQIEPYLRGQRLFGYVDGSITKPPTHITNPAATTSETALSVIPNPNYTLWFDQDQVVLNTLVSSLSENILAHMVGISTSREVWVALETIFSSHSRARAMQTRQILSVIKKGNQSISDYFQKIKTHADTLAAIGESLLPHEFQSYLLGGLDSTYDAIVTAIITRSDPMSKEDLFSHLLNFELRLEHHNSALEATIGSVNVATRSEGFRPRGSKQFSPLIQSYQQNNFRPPQHSYQQNNFRGRGRTGRTKGSSGQQPSSQPLCQVCGKTGHTSIQCYHRFDQAYQGAPPTMVAYLTNQQSASDANWYPDTGSTNHLTNEFQHLNIHSEPYTGGDQIQVGDGAGRNQRENSTARQD